MPNSQLNAPVVVFDEDGKIEVKARLRNGKYERTRKYDGEFVQLAWFRLLKSSTAEAHYAVAYFNYDFWGLGTSNYGVVQLLEPIEGHWQVVQQILLNLRGSAKGGATFNPESDGVTLKAVNCWEHSCGTKLDIVRFQLDHGILKQTSYVTAPIE